MTPTSSVQVASPPSLFTRSLRATRDSASARPVNNKDSYLSHGSDSASYLRGESSHRAKVNHIARQLGHQHLLHISTNLHVAASSSGAQVLYTSHLQ
ncbi:hypothetical protein E2C01_019974 [Portunus trituberculatus]|uniref:Uncharacterized protein n=1 Tax=Portunus trituberculatus TaxID=210409 RepID=A0A5B7E1W3_PORTR|nr:hypothetical protein [Portunus trituberculatus]